MSDKKQVLVIGSGRLVTRVLHALQQFENFCETKHVPSKSFRENEETVVQEASLQNARNVLLSNGIQNASAIVLADTNDDINLHILLAILKIRSSVPIIATFFHDKLTVDLERQYANLTVINPAREASQQIAQVIESTTKPEPKKWFRRSSFSQPHRLEALPGRTRKLLLGFALLFLVGVSFFHFSQNTGILESIYLMATIITSVNFNDAQLANNSLPIRIALIAIMMATYAYVLYMLAIVIDELDKHRTESAIYGRKRYKLSHHVIICGLGRVGYELTDFLLKRRIKMLVIEKDQDNKFLRQIRYRRKVPVFIGDASLSDNLADAGVMNARALVSVVDDDFVNLEIALVARSLNPKIRIGLRVFDQEVAEEIKSQLNLHHAFSKSAIAAQIISQRLQKILSPTPN